MFSLQHISKRFGSNLILDNISYNFSKRAIIAIIGANGAGKTTLLNILSGLDEPDDGLVKKSKELVIGYLPQEPNFRSQTTILDECISGTGRVYELKTQLEGLLLQMENNYSQELYEQYEKIESLFRTHNGYVLEANAKVILSGLGFDNEQFLKDPKSLSGGWKMRLELAKILLKNPDFLILDEPTNHLDLPSIVWLEQYLKKFQGTLLFVSHDEDLLNRLAKIVLHLHNGKITEYHGNFDGFLMQYEQSQMQKMSQSQQMQCRIANVERFVERFKAKASKASQAKSRMKMLERLREEAKDIVIDKDSTEINISLHVKHKSGQDVLLLEKCSIGYDKSLSKNISFYLERGKKLAIIGANGVGKSTLLKSIAGEIPFLTGNIKLGYNVNIGYFTQEQLAYFDLNKSVLDNLLNANPELSTANARSLLGSFLLKGDAVYKPVSVLSGGERSRLALACLLAQDVNFLLLDEPTNHLDMASIEVLANALAQYEGTVIIVSHNRKFINQIATHVFVLTKDGKSQVFEGKLDDYERLAQVSGFPNILLAK